MLGAFNDLKDAQKLAKEWAKLANYDAPWHIIAEEMSWGFREVESGSRHPDIVLKDVIERIEKRKASVAKPTG
jgi:hypothetical protein